jgi:hypothetical protein
MGESDSKARSLSLSAREERTKEREVQFSLLVLAGWNTHHDERPVRAARGRRLSRLWRGSRKAGL